MNSIVLIERDEFPPIRGDFDDADRRKRSPRTGVLLAIIAAHIGVVWTIIAAPGESVRAPETESYVPVFIRPRLVVSQDPIAQLPRIRVPRDAPVLNDLQIPDIDRPPIAALGVGLMPSHPKD